MRHGDEVTCSIEAECPLGNAHSIGGDRGSIDCAIVPIPALIVGVPIEGPPADQAIGGNIAGHLGYRTGA